MSWNYANAQVTGSNARRLGLFHSLDLLCCNCRQVSAFCISSLPCPPGQMPRGSGMAWGLSFGPCPWHCSLQVFLPALTHIPSSGAGPLLTFEGIFLLLFPSLLLLLHLSCSLLLEFQIGAELSLQDSFSISPVLSHIHLFLPFLSVGGNHLLTLIFQMTNLDFVGI